MTIFSSGSSSQGGRKDTTHDSTEKLRQRRGTALTGTAFHLPPCLLLPLAAAAVVLAVVRLVALVLAAVLAALCVVVFICTVVVRAVALVWAVVLAVVVLARALVLAAGLVLVLCVVLVLTVRLMVTLGAVYLSEQKQLMSEALYKQNFGSLGELR